jgi:hypothetical protein
MDRQECLSYEKAGFEFESSLFVLVGQAFLPVRRVRCETCSDGTSDRFSWFVERKATLDRQECLSYLVTGRIDAGIRPIQ